MDKRVSLLGIAALVIAGLCVYKVNQTYTPQRVSSDRPPARPAPSFELYEQSSPSKLVRLEGYLGRHQVFVAFFDGKAGGAHRSPALSQMRNEYERLRRAGVYVMAISAALPQENRKIIAEHGPFPFPLLSDPGFQVHQAWGRFDETKSTPREGVFLVDRRGSVAWSRNSNTPQPLVDWASVLQNLVEGR